MDKVSDNVVKAAYKPYDVVSDARGNIGLIQDVSFCKSLPAGSRVAYSVHWVVGQGDRHAWYSEGELKKHTNLFIEMSKMACDKRCGTEKDVDRIFNLGI